MQLEAKEEERMRAKYQDFGEILCIIKFNVSNLDH
jgi:hypothetical protein